MGRKVGRKKVREWNIEYTPPPLKYGTREIGERKIVKLKALLVDEDFNAQLIYNRRKTETIEYFRVELPSNGGSDYVIVHRWAYVVKGYIGIKAPEGKKLVVELIELISKNPKIPNNYYIKIHGCDPPTSDNERPSGGELGYIAELGFCWPPGRRCASIVTTLERDCYGTVLPKEREKFYNLREIHVYPALGEGYFFVDFDVSFPNIVHVKEYGATGWPENWYQFRFKVDNRILKIVPIH